MVQATAAIFKIPTTGPWQAVLTAETRSTAGSFAAAPAQAAADAD